MEKRYSKIKRAAIIILPFVIIPFLLFGFIQTNYGITMIAYIVNNRVLNKTGIRVELGKIQGIVPFNINGDRIALFDESGMWLEIKDFRFKISPLKLAAGHIFVKELTVRSAALERLPLSRDEDSVKKPISFRLPSVIHRIESIRMAVEELSLGQTILGEQAVFFVDARIMGEKKQDKNRLYIKCARTDIAGDIILLDAGVKDNGRLYSIDAMIEESGKGLLGKLTGIEGPIRVEMNGAGPPDDIKGILTINAPQAIEVNSDIQMGISGTLKTAMKGSIHIHEGFLPENIILLTGTNAEFKLDSELMNDWNLTLNEISIENEISAVSIKGALDISTMHAEGDFDISMSDLAMLRTVLKGEPGGSIEARGRFEGPLFGPEIFMSVRGTDLVYEQIGLNLFSGDFSMSFPDKDESSQSILSITGKGETDRISLPVISQTIHERLVTWELDADFMNNSVSRINIFKAVSESVSFNISGVFDHASQTGSGDLDLAVNDLKNYSHLTGYDIPAALILKTVIEADTREGSFRSENKGTLSFHENEADNRLKLFEDSIEYSGKVEYSEKDNLKISDLFLESDNMRISGSAQYNPESGETDSTLTMIIPQLGIFDDLAGKAIRGSADISASLTGRTGMYNLKVNLVVDRPGIGDIFAQQISAAVDISGDKDKNNGQILLKIDHPESDIEGRSNLSFQDNTLAFTDINVEGSGLLLEGEIIADMTMNNPNLHLQFRGKDLSLIASINNFAKDSLRLDLVQFASRGNLKESQFTLYCAGRAGEEFSMSLKGNHSFSNKGQSISVTELKGKFSDNAFDLVKPLEISRTGDLINLEEFEMSLAQGIVRGSWMLNRESIRMDIILSDIHLNSLLYTETLNMDGVLDGSLQMSGRPDLPEIDSKINISEIRFQGVMFEDLPLLTLKFESRLENRLLRSSFLLTGATNQALQGVLDIPLDLSISPYMLSVNRDEEIKGNISGKANLDTISSVMEMRDQQFSGLMDIDFDIGGSFNRPEITGYTTLSRGFYENIHTGTVLREIELDITSESREFQVRNFRAIDGRGGEIKGNGRISIISEKNFPYSVDLRISHAGLYNTDDISLIIDGQTTLAGNLLDHSLEGSINIERGDIRIPDTLPPGITDIEVIEINRLNTGDELTEERKGILKPLVHLNLLLKSSGRIYINGRGITSEWRGDLTIKGTDAEPLIKGELKLLRGNYTFLGKRFDLTEGSIIFDGRHPPSPDLLISGRIKNGDITAIIELSGNVNSPEIKLSSIPSLPSDEILSRILFSRDVSQITPLQAVQLGNAINTMLGGRSYDLIGKTRRALGVDQLEIRQSGDNMDESVLSAGKYLNERIYLEVEKGIGRESGKAALKWEISPNISVETEVGEDTETGIGINWKWDY